MRILVQRSLNSSVSVNDKVIGKIDKGLVIFVGFTHNDSIEECDHLVNKVLNLRIFDDENGIMNKSVLDIEGSILSVSQFTLYANTKKGNRPSYTEAIDHEEANKLYDYFNNKLSKNIKVETGKFRADMKVNIINDGPITIMLERSNKND